MSLRVFISHSSRTNRGRELAKKLHERLSAENFRPRVDLEDLQGGDLWRKMIDSWIANCEAAIVILDKAALKSDWVAYEASLLTYEHNLHRERHGRGVALLIVLDDISIDEVKQEPRYEPLDLIQFQIPHPQITAGDDGQPLDLDSSVQQIIDEFKRIAPEWGRNPFDKQVDHLAQLLDDVSITDVQNADDRLQNIWSGLPPIGSDWAPRDPNADTSPASIAATWMLNHSLVERVSRRSRWSAPAVACQQLQPTTNKVHHDELIDTLFSGWLSTRATNDLMQIVGGDVEGGRTDLPFSGPDIARRCFWAALVRSDAPNPPRQVDHRVVTPWLNIVSCGAAEDTVDTVHRRVIDAWDVQFCTQGSPEDSLDSYINEGNPVGIGLPGDDRLSDIVDAVLSVDDGVNGEDPDAGMERNANHDVLNRLSYVFSWGEANDYTMSMAAHPECLTPVDIDDPGERHIAALEHQLEWHVANTLKALRNRGLVSRQPESDPDSPDTSRISRRVPTEGEMVS